VIFQHDHFQAVWQLAIDKLGLRLGRWRNRCCRRGRRWLPGRLRPPLSGNSRINKQRKYYEE
jgi:hypothetical protein